MSQAELDLGYDGPPISLTIFRGPLDLLAYLVRSQQLDIQEIAVAEIAGQFVAFVRAMQVINIEEAAEFLPVAAALVLWKVRSLLPRDPGEPELADLVEVLERAGVASGERLAEYRAFRDAAEQLRQAHALQQQVFVRSLDEDEMETGWVSLDQVQVFDMVAALARVLERVDQEHKPVVLRPKWSVRSQMGYVVEHLRSAGGAVSFEGLFADATDRLWVVTTFLALLELIRRGRVRAQTGKGRSVVISLA
jgi:segregation and condensation protein A